MLLFEANLVFLLSRVIRDERKTEEEMNKNKMAEFWYRLVTSRKRHCFAKLTLYMHICHVCDGLYARWRVKATLRYHFKTLDRKPRPRSQSYIGPTTVGPD